MTAAEINTILGLGILVFAGTIWMLLVRSEKKPAVSQKVMLLKDLSQLWIKNGEVDIADLAPIWRDDPVVEAIDEVFIECATCRMRTHL